MDWIVGRATEGSSGRHSSTLRATPAVIPGKVGEGIANPFPKGALLAPRASGKPFGVSADTSPGSARAPLGAKPCAFRHTIKEKWRKNFHSSSNMRFHPLPHLTPNCLPNGEANTPYVVRNDYFPNCVFVFRGKDGGGNVSHRPGIQ